MMADTYTVPVFFYAVMRGAYRDVRSALGRHPDLVSVKNEGATALHFAAVENQKQIADILLDAGADLHARDDEFGMLPIAWANEKGHMGMVRHLFDRGTYLDLRLSAGFGLIDNVRRLLPAATPQMVDTALQAAALWGHVEMVQLLLQSGADPRATDEYGRTALRIAEMQASDGCRSTPIVNDARRLQITDGCWRIIGILRQANA